MRFRSNNATLIVAVLILYPGQAGATDAPIVEEERTFQEPEPGLGDVLASPFYFPERYMRMVLVPVGQGVGWLTKNQVPARVEDLLTDDTGRIRVLPFARYSTSDRFSLGGDFQFSNMFYQKKKFRISGAIAMNLDGKLSTSFSKSATLNSPIFYRIGASFKRDKDTDYYGLGFNSSKSNKSIYTSQRSGLSTGIGWRFRKLRFLRLAGAFGLQNAQTNTGEGPVSTQLVEDTFGGDELFGFGANINWIHYGLSFKYDSRIPSGHPHRGQLLTVRVMRYRDVDDRFSYIHVRAAVSRLFDLYKKENVLALTLRYEAAEDLGGSTPFYRLPTAGALRGFSKHRFVDRRSIVGSSDYKFRIWKSLRPDPAYVLGTFFVDVGKPFHDVDSLVADGLKYSVGTGLIYTTKKRNMARVVLAYGGESVETRFSIGGIF